MEGDIRYHMYYQYICATATCIGTEAAAGRLDACCEADLAHGVSIVRREAVQDLGVLA